MAQLAERQVQQAQVLEQMKTATVSTCTEISVVANRMTYHAQMWAMATAQGFGGAPRVDWGRLLPVTKKRITATEVSLRSLYRLLKLCSLQALSNQCYKKRKPGTGLHKSNLPPLTSFVKTALSAMHKGVVDSATVVTLLSQVCTRRPCPPRGLTPYPPL